MRQPRLLLLLVLLQKSLQQLLLLPLKWGLLTPPETGFPPAPVRGTRCCQRERRENRRHDLGPHQTGDQNRSLVVALPPETGTPEHEARAERDPSSMTPPRDGDTTESASGNSP